MKKILYSFLSFAALTLVACDYNNPNDGRFGNDPETGWVQFEEVSLEFNEQVISSDSYVLSGASTEFTVPVQLSAPVNKNGVTVNYTIADVDGGSASSFLTHTGEMEIPANSLVGYITFGIPAEALTSCMSFDITLTSTSDSDITVGIPTAEGNAKPITHRVTIGKGRDSFIGSYTDAIGGGTVTIVAGDKPNEIVINNLQNGGSSISFFLDISSYGGSITYPYYDANFLGIDPDLGNLYASDVYKQGALVRTVYSYFDPCTNVIMLEYFTLDANGMDINNGDQTTKAELVQQ